MSPINFDILASRHPQLNEAWDVLSRWFVANRNKRFVDVQLLKSDLGERIDSQSLAIALDLMRHANMIERVFRLRAPDGTVLNDDYTTLKNLPESVWDRFGRQQFDPNKLEAIAGYRWEGRA